MNTEHLVCTPVDELTQKVICQHFPSTRVTAYISSTASTHAIHQYVSVFASSVLDARLLPCYHANGSTSDEMNQFFEQGAMSWTLYEHTYPLSTCCFTFQNSARLWEIGGVSIDPAYPVNSPIRLLRVIYNEKQEDALKRKIL